MVFYLLYISHDIVLWNIRNNLNWFDEVLFGDILNRVSWDIS